MVFPAVVYSYTTNNKVLYVLSTPVTGAKFVV